MKISMISKIIPGVLLSWVFFSQKGELNNILQLQKEILLVITVISFWHNKMNAKFRLLLKKIIATSSNTRIYDVVKKVSWFVKLFRVEKPKII